MEERQLRAELTQELELLIVELKESQAFEGKKITQRLEKALTQSLLLEFIERKKDVFSRIQLATQQAASDIPSEGIETIVDKAEYSKAISADKEEVKTIVSEVKVLPHPEGPPLRKMELDYDDDVIEFMQDFIVGEKVVPEKPAAKPAVKSIRQKSWELGLNDRISLTKHLFNGNSSEYVRVISQLSTHENFNEAKSFLYQLVKPEYDWSEKIEFEERFLDLIEARFKSTNR